MKRTIEPLAEHTWLKIGGPADIAIPESKDEFIDLLVECTQDDIPFRILGNGSNLLVSDDGVDDLVIKNTLACTEIRIDDGTVIAGASVLVPQFVNFLVEHERGGYEYLYSVPGTIGGAIFMNAGRGRRHEKTIADYLIEVELFDGEEVRQLSTSELDFSHRYSTFHEHPEWTILSATFEPPEQPKNIGQEKVRKRMEKVNQRERTKPNAGSVFKSGTRLPLHRIPPGGLSYGDARFVSSNRICHDGDATYTDVIRLIRLAKWLHRIVPPFSTPEIEWEIWS